MCNSSLSVGTVTGTVAGARFGASEIPERWTDEIDETEEISELARNLSESGCGEFYEDLSY